MTELFAIAGLQAALGAFDTLYYHEYRCRLPYTPSAITELQLHALRDWAYGIIFFVLGFLILHGWWAYLMVPVLLMEIVITMWDFVEEDRSRQLFAGERVMHGLMAIVYGAFLVYFVGLLVEWSGEPAGVMWETKGLWTWFFGAAALGVVASGIRDWYAAIRLTKQKAA